MIAGLEDITSGELLIAGKRMNEVPPAERGIGMVFSLMLCIRICPLPTICRLVSNSLALKKQRLPSG